MNRSSQVWIFLLFAAWTTGSYGKWLPNWGLRQLLQAKDEKSDNVLQTPSFNLSCTWSDPLNSCYLDYFNHLPDSEISNFYNTDEKCRRIEDQVACNEKPFCEWTTLRNNNTKSCFAKIDQKDIDECGKQRRPKDGSLCWIWKTIDFCSKQKTQIRCQQPTFATRGFECTWTGDECLLSQETLIRTEFYPSFVDAEYVVEYEKLCDSAQSRPMCEQYRPS